MRRSGAQSLIETIVAVGIIVTAIVAILGIGLAHLRLGGESGVRVVGVNLAREGVELAITIRNSNQLNPANSWPYGLTNNPWRIDYDDLSFSLMADSANITTCSNCDLCKQPNDTYTICGSAEIFRRMVTIADGDLLGGNCSVTNCEKKITSTVYWVERSGPHTISVETRLTDWR